MFVFLSCLFLVFIDEKIETKVGKVGFSKQLVRKYSEGFPSKLQLEVIIDEFNFIYFLYVRINFCIYRWSNYIKILAIEL